MPKLPDSARVSTATSPGIVNDWIISVSRVMTTPDLPVGAQKTLLGPLSKPSPPLNNTSPVSLKLPVPSMVSRRTFPVICDVTSTEPSLQTSTELQSVPKSSVRKSKVRISVCVARSITETGCRKLPSHTTTNFWSGVSEVSSP